MSSAVQEIRHPPGLPLPRSGQLVSRRNSLNSGMVSRGRPTTISLKRLQPTAVTLKPSGHGSSYINLWERSRRRRRLPVTGNSAGVCKDKASASLPPIKVILDMKWTRRPVVPILPNSRRYCSNRQETLFISGTIFTARWEIKCYNVGVESILDVLYTSPSHKPCAPASWVPNCLAQRYSVRELPGWHSHDSERPREWKWFTIYRSQPSSNMKFSVSTAKDV